MNSIYLFSRAAIDQVEAAAGQFQPQAASEASDETARFRGGGLQVINGIGTIDLSGAMVYDNTLFGRFITTIFGGTRTPELHASLKQAAADYSIRGVVLKINSPGGEVAGTEEAARLVAELARQKPVVALVESHAASAAFWVAAQASKIVVVGKTAAVGSIGTAAVLRDTTERDAKAGVKLYQFVSSQSPRKRPDVSSDDGRAQIQQYVDALAQVFIDSVAAARGVSSEHVAQNFGQGDMLLAGQALAAGMIDQIGTEQTALELIQQMLAAKQFGAGSATNVHSEGVPMSQQPQETAAVRAEAIQLERARVAAITQHPEAAGRTELANYLAFESDMPADQAVALLAKAPKAIAATAGVFELAMGQVANPNVGAGASVEDQDSSTLIARMVAYGNHVGQANQEVN